MMRHVTRQQPSHTVQSEENPGIPVPQTVSVTSLPASKKSAILKTRAQALARIPARQGPEETGLSVIEFLVDEKTYAIESTYVREVQNFKELTPLPSTPPFVAGIINVRGRILAVVDIRILLGLTSEVSLSQKGVIILHSGTRELGILTDGMLGVHSIPLSQLYPIPPTFASAKAQYLRGVTGSQTIILHTLQLLSAPHDPNRPNALSLATDDAGRVQSAVSGRGPSSLPVSATSSS